MRKYLFISLAILLVAGLAIAAPGNQTSPGHGDKLGQGGLASDPGKIFRLVRYVPTSGSTVSATLAANSIVIWDLVSDDGVTVTTTTTSYDTAVAGIIVANALTPETLGNTAFADVGKRNWTWLQTYGKSLVNIQGDSDTSSAGDAMSCGSDAGEACDFVGGGTDAQTQGMAGFFYDDGAAGADGVECFLTLD